MATAAAAYEILLLHLQQGWEWGQVSSVGKGRRAGAPSPLPVLCGNGMDPSFLLLPIPCSTSLCSLFPPLLLTPAITLCSSLFQLFRAKAWRASSQRPEPDCAPLSSVTHSLSLVPALPLQSRLQEKLGGRGDGAAALSPGREQGWGYLFLRGDGEGAGTSAPRPGHRMLSLHVFSTLLSSPQLPASL